MPKCLGEVSGELFGGLADTPIPVRLQAPEAQGNGPPTAHVGALNRRRSLTKISAVHLSRQLLQCFNGRHFQTINLVNLCVWRRATAFAFASPRNHSRVSRFNKHCQVLTQRVIANPRSQSRSRSPNGSHRGALVIF